MSQDELRHAVTQKPGRVIVPPRPCVLETNPRQDWHRIPERWNHKRDRQPKTVTALSQSLWGHLISSASCSLSGGGMCFNHRGIFFSFFLHKHRWFYLDSLPLSKRRGASSTFTMRHRKNITVSSQSACFESFITVLTSASPRQTDFISSAWAPIL